MSGAAHHHFRVSLCVWRTMYCFTTRPSTHTHARKHAMHTHAREQQQEQGRQGLAEGLSLRRGVMAQLQGRGAAAALVEAFKCYADR
jgi:hypothetical protein